MTKCVDKMKKCVNRFTKCVEMMTKCVAQKSFWTITFQDIPRDVYLVVYPEYVGDVNADVNDVDLAVEWKVKLVVLTANKTQLYL